MESFLAIYLTCLKKLNVSKLIDILVKVNYLFAVKYLF